MKNKYVGDNAIPYYSQKAAFLYEEGSLNRSQVDEWENSLCGLMCVGMIINRFSIDLKHTIAELLNSANKLGAFHQQKGWIHKKLALLAEEYGIEGTCQIKIDLDTIYELLTTDNLIIASVSPNYLHPEQKNTVDERGGHLVVITGMSCEESGNYKLFIHDPSSEVADGGQNLVVDSSIFKPYFSGNIIAFKNPQS